MIRLKNNINAQEKCAETLINFKGSIFNIGIDVHKKTWKVCIRNNNMELVTLTQDPNPETLFNYLQKNYFGGTYYAVYEAGFCGFSYCRRLNALGIKTIVVNAADVPTSDKEKKNKSDPIDCRKLARTLEAGELTGIAIPTEEEEAKREMFRQRKQFVKDRQRLVNRIKGFLHFIGVIISEEANTVKGLLNWLKTLEFKQKENQESINRYAAMLDYVNKEVIRLDMAIRQEHKKNKLLRLLKTIPGIGYLVAFALVAELWDMKRFKNFNQLASMVGLSPNIQGSGDYEGKGVLTSRHNKHLRYLLIEAAWVAVRKDPIFLKKYNELTKRMSPQQSIIRIAKKLLSRIRSVWLNEQEYVFGVAQ